MPYMHRLKLIGGLAAGLLSVAAQATSTYMMEMKIWANDELIATPLIKGLRNDIAVIRLDGVYEMTVRVGTEDGHCFVSGSLLLFEVSGVSDVSFKRPCAPGQWVTLSRVDGEDGRGVRVEGWLGD